MSKHRRIFTVLLALFPMAAPCFGDIILSYTLDPASYTASPGDTVNVVANLQNTGTDTLYVNYYLLTLNGLSQLYLSEDFFFNFYNSVPGTFATTDPAADYIVEQIDVAPGIPNGSYTDRKSTR